MKLTVNSGSKAGTVLDLTGRAACVVGREGDCDLVLDEDTKVSRRHASFESTPDGGVQLRDLGSANGTFVNGARVSDTVRLLGGEAVLIGTTSVAVTNPIVASGAGPTEPAAFAPSAGSPAAPLPGMHPGEAAPPADLPRPPVAPIGATNLAPAGGPGYAGGGAPPPYLGGPPGQGAPPPYLGGGGAPPPGYGGGGPGYGPPSNPNRGRIIGLSIAAAVLAIGIIVVLIILLTGDDDEKKGEDRAGERTGSSSSEAAAEEGSGFERYCSVLEGLEADLNTIPEPADDEEAQRVLAQFLSDHRRDFITLVALAQGPQRGDLGTIITALERAADGDATALADPDVEDALTRLTEDEACA
ncbi:MAG: FHA domain-containing protein [Sporichthyaceae bacterium]